MSKVALFDYDGFICKAFYASVARNELDIDSMLKVLNDLTNTAEEKVSLLSDGDYKIIKVISGHTFKKDIYPSYKQSRKKNEYLGVFRDFVKENFTDLCLVSILEADDVIIMLYERYKDAIVFSDDKDLRYYCPNYCKININETPALEEDNEKAILEQMLIGDKEDSITGVPKVGEVTSRKLLEKNGYSLENVIRIYRDYNVSIDDCMRDISLVTPLCSRWTKNYKYGLDNKTVMENILNRYSYLNEKIKEIYFEKQN